MRFRRERWCKVATPWALKAGELRGRLAAEADAGRNHADRLAPGASQDDLGPPEDKGVGRARAVLQGLQSLQGPRRCLSRSLTTSGRDDPLWMERLSRLCLVSY
jgi:hypothetical protein